MVAAPSGAGKTSVVAAALAAEPSLRLSISCTTRPPRASEVHGRDYFFVDEAEFARAVTAGEFLEWANVHGNRYGTLRSRIEQSLAAGQDIVLEIDWQGARQVRRLRPTSISVFILPPSLAALSARLKARGQDDDGVIGRRLAAARTDLAHVAEFDYVIMNLEFERAVRDLLTIIRAERLRRAPQLARYADVLNQFQ